NRNNGPGLVDSDEIAEKFREHAEQLSGSDFFKDAEKAVLAKAGDDAQWITGADFDDDDKFIDVVAKGTAVPLPHNQDEAQPMVALLPSRRLWLTLGDLKWIVRTRPTVTSCSLQRTSEPTKMWWTFEGIPQHNQDRKQPNGHDAARFLAVSQQMADVAMPLLNKAYWWAFKKAGHNAEGISEPEKTVRVCLCDVNTREMAALLDAFLHHRRPSQIRSSEGDARMAMDEFDNFVREVAQLRRGHRPAESSIEISDILPGARGILSRQVDRENRIFLAGFARRLGARVSASLLPDDLRASTRSESYLRAISAARPLSAAIAEEQARRLGGATPREKTVLPA
ncbi:MAG: hypothetical protein PS018_00805, partial [bacterium]|nr:hypothetical protein [bacterium]